MPKSRDEAVKIRKSIIFSKALNVPCKYLLGYHSNLERTEGIIEKNV